MITHEEVLPSPNHSSYLLYQKWEMVGDIKVYGT